MRSDPITKDTFVAPPRPEPIACACGVPVEPRYIEPEWWKWEGRDRLFVGSGEWIRRTMCDECARAAREKAEREAVIREEKERAAEYDRLIRASGFAPREIDIIAKPWIGPEKSKAPFYAWKDSDRSLYIFGKPGNGKTHAAVVALDSYIKTHRKPGKFFVVADLFRKLRSAVKTHNDDEMIDEIIRLPALVLDDIAVERPTGFVLEALQSILDTRFRNKARTLITSNLSLSELAEKMDDRIASRLSDPSMCDVIEFTGKDKRLTGGAA